MGDVDAEVAQGRPGRAYVMVSGPAPVVRIELDLLDDGEPGAIFRPLDGRGSWLLPFVGNVPGAWRLEARVVDARGCGAALDVLPIVRVR